MPHRDDYRSVSIPWSLFDRAKAKYHPIDLAVEATAAALVRADLRRKGVDERDPGEPKIKRVQTKRRRGAKVRRRTVRFPPRLWKRARVYAASVGLSLSAYVVSVIERDLAEDDNDEAVDATIEHRAALAREITAEQRSAFSAFRRCRDALAEAGLEAGGVHLF